VSPLRLRSWLPAESGMEQQVQDRLYGAPLQSTPRQWKPARKRFSFGMPVHLREYVPI